MVSLRRIPRQFVWWLQTGWRWHAWEWCQRVIYCHHNARVLVDMEYRLGCVLSECTSGMSKAYYTKEAMIAEIHDYIEQNRSDAIDDFCTDNGLKREEMEG